jgi:hypothetical protein
MSDPEAEVKVLVEEIQRLGEQLENGKWAVQYGKLVSDARYATLHLHSSMIHYISFISLLLSICFL